MVSRQAAADAPGLSSRPLVLQLVIVDAEPLTGWICRQQQPAVRIDFSGWIGLMSAINDLRAEQAGA